MDESEILVEEHVNGVDGADFGVIVEQSETHFYEEEVTRTTYIDQPDAEEGDFSSISGEVEEVLWDDVRTRPDRVKVQYRTKVEEYNPEKHVEVFERRVKEFIDGKKVIDMDTHVVPEEESERHRYEAHILYREED